MLRDSPLNQFLVMLGAAISAGHGLAGTTSPLRFFRVAEDWVLPAHLRHRRISVIH
jgi:hypothetical protein